MADQDALTSKLAALTLKRMGKALPRAIEPLFAADRAHRSVPPGGAKAPRYGRNVAAETIGALYGNGPRPMVVADPVGAEYSWEPVTGLTPLAAVPMPSLAPNGGHAPSREPAPQAPAPKRVVIAPKAKPAVLEEPLLRDPKGEDDQGGGPTAPDMPRPRKSSGFLGLVFGSRS